MATKAKAVEAESDPFAEFEFSDKLNTSFVQGPANPRGMRETPEEKSRRVLCEALDEQVKLLDNPEYTRQVARYVKGQGKVYSEEAPKPIWVEDDEGNCFVTVRYGVRPFPVKPGMPTAKMKREQVKPYIQKVAELIKSGAYDSVLLSLSKR